MNIRNINRRSGTKTGARSKISMNLKFPLIAGVASGLVVVPTLVVAVIYIGQSYTTSQQAKQACDVEPGAAYTAIIDISDPITDSQSRAIDVRVKEFIGKTNMGDVVNVVVLTEDPQAPIQWVETVCDPGSGENHGTVFNTPAIVDKERDEKYLSKLSAAVLKAKIPEKKDFTPLLEALFVLSKNETFHGNSIGSAKRRELLIISDNMQHAKTVEGILISSYRGTLTRSEGYEVASMLMPDFTGVTIHRAVIDRPEHRKNQLGKNRKFIEQHLKSSGANVPMALPIM